MNLNDPLNSLKTNPTVLLYVPPPAGPPGQNNQCPARTTHSFGGDRARHTLLGLRKVQHRKCEL